MFIIRTGIKVMVNCDKCDHKRKAEKYKMDVAHMDNTNKIHTV